MNYKYLENNLKRFALIASASVLIACAGGSANSNAKQETTSHPVESIDSKNKLKSRKENTERDSIKLEQAAAAEVVTTGSRQIRETLQSPAPLKSVAADSVYIQPAPPIDPIYLPENTENYAELEESAIKRVDENPVSTFSVDVDTGSYTNVRRMLNNGYLPPENAVRVEEFINYFDYDYKTPRNTKDPFLVNTELSQTPWNKNSKLLRVGLKAYQIDADKRPAANLVFLLDVSGSMNSQNKLPLLKKSFRMLTKNLNADDRVSIVVYAGASGVVLEPTPGNERRDILTALSRLQAGGSTNGAAGINLAYQLAEEAFIEDGINRILIATDGDFNVGTSGVESLKRLIEDKREKGISFTTLGFGSGNYNDHLMEQLADVGNGNHAYIDSVKEAEKVLVTEMNSTLLTVAKDVKIQVEFNPKTVSEYRLIGYENRALKREDFNNDKVDAGEIGAGHSVTALYEVFPSNASATIDPLRYGKNANMIRSEIIEDSKHLEKELAFVKLRFKYPDAEKSTLREFPVQTKQEVSFKRASQEFKFAVAVSAFGQKLKRTKYLNNYTFENIVALADKNKGKDHFGYREEFIELVEIADGLMANDEHLMSDHIQGEK